MQWVTNYMLVIYKSIDFMISNNCLSNSLLVIPFFVSKLSLKLGSEKLPLTLAPWKEDGFRDF
jgi:hypothetical protein